MVIFSLHIMNYCFWLLPGLGLYAFVLGKSKFWMISSHDGLWTMQTMSMCMVNFFCYDHLM